MAKNMNLQNLEEKVFSAEIRRCWIGNDSLGSYTSIFANAFKGAPVTHWWVSIKT